jgi:peptide/nickel transport system substrate-binding protein
MVRTGNVAKAIKRAALAGALLIGLGAPGFAQDRTALMQQHRGGELRLLAKAAGGSIDPHINYTLQYWQIFQMTYDGLLAFKKAQGAEGFVVVPNLAEAIPAATNDGKTYVFKLRPGVKFSNGKDVTVDDVVASFQRIFKVVGPTSGSFYNGIVGADACLKTPDTCTLEGGISADKAAGTVTINLVEPDPEFFYKVSVPHAAVLPADAPSKDSGSVPVPGTGAYMIESYDANKQMVVVRNPHFKEWSVDAQPDGFVDKVLYDFGLTEEAQINAIVNGQADWTLDPPPPDRLAELGTKYADQVTLSPLTAVWYAPMNTNIPPFNNVKARQALNFAVDRKALAGLFGGRNLATPVCQVLPPNFPGHEPFCLYTANPGEKWSAPDLEKAKALVEESGTKGQPVAIITEDSDVSRNVGIYLQSVLKDLGYDASVKPISSNIQFTYIQNTNNKVQISVSQWYQDYPAASNFLNVLLGCGSFREASDSSINIAGFCDKDIQARMDAAKTLGATDPVAANKQWAEIDKAVMEKAPWVPLFTPKRVDLISKRVGNFTFSNQFYFVMALAWVQ